MTILQKRWPSHEDFEGWYFKHQQGRHTLALIPGRSKGSTFIQIITDNESYQVNYPLEEYQMAETLRIESNEFSKRGILLAIRSKGISLNGALKYGQPARIHGDIMGPFRLFPMECKHSIISMVHSISGSVILNGKRLDFDGGKGYIEGDRGSSFPSAYAWIQCNDFAGECSIMASVARIPFYGLRFWGCICVILLDGHEYRIATYKGARIRQFRRGLLVLEQGKYRLEAGADASGGHKLAAPESGAMSRTIRESASCTAYFRFTCKDEVLFEETSRRASYEYARENRAKYP